ncbi:Phosphatidylserine decarboxylase [Thermodesulfovibrio sp. N1]|uniref:phosphatidylserine decarboxylase family protein n=1 Tax=unclassified Thermodesulfovibrio TaxID=2645936 RepID=UPI00083A5FE3|nr:MULTISPECIES: phosphatidylserine decarboxylase family protein [unclassified Thermodesulfovibrio]MDI1471382.1 phosphatidylserine decarboxylase family protein [Thermodesulfovibrio sp. 1176]ODA44335.1 Phosphatidylserine decarboxylase [Thermodesulfovibrio sp. N1]
MIRKEVIPYIAGGLFLSSFFYLLRLEPLAIVCFGLCLFFLYFFRDPERIPPADPHAVVSPADGKIISINQNSSLCCENYIEISIFMSPFDVHVNRVPFDGVVKEIIHTPGKFFSAFKEKAYRENENIKITFETPYGVITVRQVAGFIARRSVCWLKEGQTLKKGDRLGMIKFSSRVDICLPSSFKIQVKVGDKVKAGKTVIAFLQ